MLPGLVAFIKHDMECLLQSGEHLRPWLEHPQKIFVGVMKKAGEGSEDFGPLGLI